MALDDIQGEYTAAENGTYTVKRADNLSKIAKSLGLGEDGVQALIALNKDRYPTLIDRPGIIDIGWELKTPGGLDQQAATQTPSDTAIYKVKPGDSLWKISKELGFKNPDALIEANKDLYPSLLSTPDVINPGWEFKVPAKDAAQIKPSATELGSRFSSAATGEPTVITNAPTAPSAPAEDAGTITSGFAEAAGEITAPAVVAAAPAQSSRPDAQSQTVEPPPASAHTETAEIAIDRKSPKSEIRGLQTDLTALGFPLTKDGVFGPKTKQAVMDYQGKFGLPATGEVDSATLASIEVEIADLKAAAENALRANIITAAEIHLGVTEEGGDNRGARITEYLNGKAPNGASWCAGFASHILKSTAPGAFSYSVVAKDFIPQFEKHGAFHKFADGYTPKAGDMIVFDRGGWKGHVGFVKEIKPDGSIVTIEGNKQDPELIEAGIEEWVANNPDAVREVVYADTDALKEEGIIGFGDTAAVHFAVNGIHAPAETMLAQAEPVIQQPAVTPFKTGPV